MTDWTQWGHKEIGLEEIQKLTRENQNIWAWANGMFIAGTDDYIALRFAKGFSYEPVTRALWRMICKDAELVIDVGSHSGVFTLDAFRGGAKRCLTVEPHPINYSRLVMNVRFNNFPVNGLYYGAAGDENKIDTLLIKGGLIACHAAGRVGMHNKNGIEIPIKVVRLDNLVPLDYFDKVKAVKIDAENLTPQVIKGMGKILDHRPDLIVEATQDGLDEVLGPLGYKYWLIRESGSIEEVGDLKPINTTHNYNGTDEDCRNRFCSIRPLP